MTAGISPLRVKKEMERFSISRIGRVLPAPMWDALYARADLDDDPWDADDEIVPLDLVDLVATPSGLRPVAEVLQAVDCPVAAELLVDRRDLD